MTQNDHVFSELLLPDEAAAREPSSTHSHDPNRDKDAHTQSDGKARCAAAVPMTSPTHSPSTSYPPVSAPPPQLIESSAPPHRNLSPCVEANQDAATMALTDDPATIAAGPHRVISPTSLGSTTRVNPVRDVSATSTTGHGRRTVHDTGTASGVTRTPSHRSHGEHTQTVYVDNTVGHETYLGRTHVRPMGARLPPAVIDKRAAIPHTPIDPFYRHVVAVVNPGSGTNATSAFIYDVLLRLLGAARVRMMKKADFANPVELRAMIRDYAVVSVARHKLDLRTAARARGTILVAGGDGTLSFMQSQVDAVRAELARSRPRRPPLPREGSAERRASPSLAGSVAGQWSSVGSVGAGSVFSYDSDAEDGLDGIWDGAHYHVLPAIAPVPLGTGNDFANSLGFGSGFVQGGCPGCCNCCKRCCARCCGVCKEVESLVEQLDEIVELPCVAFDRWAADLVPLRVAQSYFDPYRLSVTETGSRGVVESMKELDTAARDATAAGTAERALVEWPANVSIANLVHGVDWDGIWQDGQCPTRSIMNYFSVGYDAYITCCFDKLRREHPGLCATRLQNKALYGVCGVIAAARCRPLRELIPMVVVPSPWCTTTTHYLAHIAATEDEVPKLPEEDDVPRSSGGVGPVRQLRAELARPSSEDDDDNNDNGAVTRDLIALQLPQHSKVLLMSNVSSYAAGTTPWEPLTQPPQYTTVDLDQDRLVVGTSVVQDHVAASPVAVNDRRFEVQTMGGVFNYGTMRIGLSHATKMMQTDEMFIFVLCTPDDLRYPRTQFSPYTRTHLQKHIYALNDDAGMRASLNVQIDGEAMPRVAEPTIIRIRPYTTRRVRVRCRNMAVVKHLFIGPDDGLVDAHA